MNGLTALNMGVLMCVCVCVYLAEVRISLSICLYMFFLLFFGLGAAGRQFWRRLLYCLRATQDANLSPTGEHLTVCGSGPYPLVFHHFADIDGCLGVLPEVPLLLEQETLSALPAQI